MAFSALPFKKYLGLDNAAYGLGAVRFWLLMYNFVTLTFFICDVCARGQSVLLVYLQTNPLLTLTRHAPGNFLHWVLRQHAAV